MHYKCLGSVSIGQPCKRERSIAMEVISSKTTFLCKFLLPVIFAVFSFAVLIFDRSSSFHPANNEIISRHMKIISLGYPFLFIGFPIWAFGGLKKVCIDGEYLFISNYLRQVRVPIANIASVEERGRRAHRIRIYLKEKTEFGSKIDFVPRGLALPWQQHPIFGRLRKITDKTAH
jgi:hypothetical protein